MPKRTALVVNQYAFPREYGGITRNFDMFSRLQNWQFGIISSRRHHTTGELMSSVDPRFSLVPVPAYSGNGAMRVVGWALFAAEAFAVGLTKKADLVFASSPQLLAPVAGLAVATVRRKPFVLEVRDLWPESLVSGGSLAEGSLVHKILVRVEKLLYRRAKRIITVTAGWEDHFRSLGIDPTKVTVVPNGADLAEFDVAESKDELRSRYGVEGFTAVFSGNHSNYVGLELVLEAAEQLPDVNFWLIGSGSRKQWAVDEVARRGLGNVRFHDQVPKDELVRLLRAGDVGLHTVSPQSVFDKGMSPNKLYDYLASGLMVVSNAKEPLREVISDDEVGAVVDPTDLVEGIRRVRDADQATRDRWLARARELMTGRFSLQASARALEAALDEAASA
ncbi:glycosyltransferase family 4 protein [Aestuariimicrobium ganziense]|uniref:glycosyltransferase family 4 protein n=1 Tax=Aestuariimicrobium ganziense TaxID=2773677 RepID=UPI0019429626|nr:glycosyltransferase family 4 protein [Aestuariimicrobium ganziense]